MGDNIRGHIGIRSSHSRGEGKRFELTRYSIRPALIGQDLDKIWTRSAHNHVMEQKDRGLLLAAGLLL